MTPEQLIKKHRLCIREDICSLFSSEPGSGALKSGLGAMQELSSQGKVVLCNVKPWWNLNNLVTGWVWLDGIHDEQIKRYVSESGCTTADNVRVALEKILGMDLEPSPRSVPPSELLMSHREKIESLMMNQNGPVTTSLATSIAGPYARIVLDDLLAKGLISAHGDGYRSTAPNAAWRQIEQICPSTT